MSTVSYLQIFRGSHDIIAVPWCPFWLFKDEAWALASPVGALSFICLQNSLFAEALNVASLHLYADHSYTNKDFPNVCCSKITSTLFMLLSTPEDIIPAVIFPRRSSLLYIEDFIMPGVVRGEYELLSLLLLLIGIVFYYKQPGRQQVKNESAFQSSCVRRLKKRYLK